jgi:hypothetical protein
VTLVCEGPMGQYAYQVTARVVKCAVDATWSPPASYWIA